MYYKDDKQGSKLIFFAIAVIIIYIAFFNFNIPDAYTFTVNSIQDFFGMF